MAERTVVPDSGTIAAIHKKIYHKSAAFGDQQLKASYKSFNNAVGASHSNYNSSQSLKTTTSKEPVDKVNNYYLTDQQKNLLQKKASDFAEPGIVPYDVLEDFLYALCYIDDYPTLKLVADTTGVKQLDNPSIVREPSIILNLEDLYKVGYLANGLSALTKQIQDDLFTQARSASDSNKSAYSALQTAASSTDEALRTITSFPGVSTFGSIFSQVLSLTSTIQGLISTFSSPGSTATKISTITSALSQATSLTQAITQTLDVSKQQNIAGLFPLANQITTITTTFQNTINDFNTLKNVVSSDSFPLVKVNDLNIQMESIFSNVQNVLSSLNSVSSLLSSLKGPGNIGKAAGVLLSLPSGMTTGSVITQTVLGQAVPPSILANNPMMLAASHVGKALFGESLIPAVTTDQVFKRKIGIYPQPSSGAGMASFSMQNSASMGGALSIQSVFLKIVYGLLEMPAGPLANVISSQISNIASTVGASINSTVEMRRSDNAIPMMIGMATVLANDSGCPFSTSVFSDGWKTACSVGNDLQNSNPEYLKSYQAST